MAAPAVIRSGLKAGEMATLLDRRAQASSALEYALVTGIENGLSPQESSDFSGSRRQGPAEQQVWPCSSNPPVSQPAN